MSGLVALELGTVARLELANPPLNLVTGELLEQLDAALATLELLEQLAGDEVERRVVQLETRDGSELERDQPAHRTASKSAARPMAPAAYRRRSICLLYTSDAADE